MTRGQGHVGILAALAVMQTGMRLILMVGSITSGRAEVARGQGLAVNQTGIDGVEIAKWDPGVTRGVVGLLRPVVKRYHRSEVHGLENIPPGGCLVVSNPSGGEFPMDWHVFVVDFYDKTSPDVMPDVGEVIGLTERSRRFRRQRT